MKAPKVIYMLATSHCTLSITVENEKVTLVVEKPNSMSPLYRSLPNDIVPLDKFTHAELFKLSNTFLTTDDIDDFIETVS